MHFDQVLAHFKLAKRQGYKTNKYGETEYRCHCPTGAHPKGDRSAGLSLFFDSNAGKTIMHCFVGCAASDICAAAGLRESDLFDGRDEYGAQHNSKGQYKGPYKVRRFPLTKTLIKIRYWAWVLHLYSADRSHGSSVNYRRLYRAIRIFARLIPRLEQSHYESLASTVLVSTHDLTNQGVTWDANCKLRFFTEVMTFLNEKGTTA